MRHLLTTYNTLFLQLFFQIQNSIGKLLAPAPAEVVDVQPQRLLRANANATTLTAHTTQPLQQD
jgi:hypothetical protein